MIHTQHDEPGSPLPPTLATTSDTDGFQVLRLAAHPTGVEWMGMAEIGLEPHQAVCTRSLAEARSAASRMLRDARAPQGDVHGPRLWSDVAALTDRGGRIGPLPDDTWIDVRPLPASAVPSTRPTPL